MSSAELLDLMQHDRIETHFHAITSIRRQTVIGVEALSRGLRASDSGALVPPIEMFNAAREAGIEMELDRACRRAAVRAFAPLHKQNPSWILFLNIHTPALTVDMDGEHSIPGLVAQAGIDPRNVALEVLEHEIPDAPALQKAIADYRKRGFLVVLDDIGAGHSNLDRIAFIKPDIIKADRGLVSGLDGDYHRQEVFKSLVHLSEKIGGWIVVEGVETSGEAQAAMDLGADLMQGFLFTRPQKPSQSTIDYGARRVEEVGVEFKQRVLQLMDKQRAARTRRLEALAAAREALEGVAPDEFEERLHAVAEKFEVVDALSVLDADGVQVTPSVLTTHQQRNKSVIFAPPEPGNDHSMKEYVYVLRECGVDPFETAPYVPMPCGELCVTSSTFFRDAEGERRILVAHMMLQVEHVPQVLTGPIKM